MAHCWPARSCSSGTCGLSQTHPPNSDSANILLTGWDLRHGYLLPHGWRTPDVPFCPTELSQYALLESVLGP